MGHVALGHVKKGMQVALGTNAVRAAAASAGGIVGSLSQSQLGDLGEKLVNSQFSQRQESKRTTTPTICCASAALIRRTGHQLRETG
jgi:hypothetical protein